jgi:hypothetical protein
MGGGVERARQLDLVIDVLREVDARAGGLQGKRRLARRRRARRCAAPRAPCALRLDRRKDVLGSRDRLRRRRGGGPGTGSRRPGRARVFRQPVTVICSLAGCRACVAGDAGVAGVAGVAGRVVGCVGDCGGACAVRVSPEMATAPQMAAMRVFMTASQSHRSRRAIVHAVDAARSAPAWGHWLLFVSSATAPAVPGRVGKAPPNLWPCQARVGPASTTRGAACPSAAGRRA